MKDSNIVTKLIVILLTVGVIVLGWIIIDDYKVRIDKVDRHYMCDVYGHC